MIIRKQDTNGTKALLTAGEIAFDNYSAGGDKGRIYIGSGTENNEIINSNDILFYHKYTLDNPSPNGSSLSDYFGNSVSIDGNYAIVGVSEEDESTNFGTGKAYIFEVSTGLLVHTLDNPNAYNTPAYDRFGTSVAISDNYAIVGTPSEDDTGGSSSGKAYIYDVTTGSLVHTLDNPNAYSTSAGDQFGQSVAISGNYAIVGASSEDFFNGSEDTGVAYIYDVTTGTHLWTLANPYDYSTTSSKYFGYSVAISGKYAIVGAYGLYDGGVNANSGAAYIYDVTTGSLVHTLDNPNAYDATSGDRFGYSVAISGSYAIVGAYQEDTASGESSGKAYIFEVSTGTHLWTLNNPNVYSEGTNDEFGMSVAISGKYAIVGTNGEAGGLDSGKAYVFDATTGNLIYTLDNPNGYSTSNYDFFGYTVSISGDHALVSARLEDDAGGSSSGKAYIFERIPINI